MRKRARNSKDLKETSGGICDFFQNITKSKNMRTFALNPKDVPSRYQRILKNAQLAHISEEERQNRAICRDRLADAGGK